MKTPEFFCCGLWRGLALITVFLAGLASIVGTTGSSGDDPPSGFAHAGRDRHVEDGHLVLLDGTRSDTPLGADPGNNVVTYKWTVISSPTLTLQPGTQLDPRAVPGEYALRSIRSQTRHGARQHMAQWRGDDVPRPPLAR